MPLFDFGESYFRDIEVLDLILEKMPVSISLGLWMTLISYLISIPLGIRKGRERWIQLRRLDLCGDHCGICHSRLPVRCFAGRSICWWLLL